MENIKGQRKFTKNTRIYAVTSMMILICDQYLLQEKNYKRMNVQSEKQRLFAVNNISVFTYYTFNVHRLCNKFF